MYDSLSRGQLKHLLTCSIACHEELDATWRDIQRAPRVTLTRAGSNTRFVIELTTTEFFYLVTSDGYWGVDWATLHDEAGQKQAFDELVQQAATYPQGDFHTETKRKFFGGYSSRLHVHCPTDPWCVLQQGEPPMWRWGAQ